MQSLPGGVLQEVQRKGEGQAQYSGGGAGSTPQRRRRMGKDASSEESETTISLATPNLTPASPPTAPLLGSGRSNSPASSHRRSRSQTPSPSGRRTGVSGGAAETSGERPHGGSGEVREAWRTPSPEEVSPELLGPGLQAVVEPDTRTPEEQFSAFTFSLKTPGGRELGTRPEIASPDHLMQQPQMDFNLPTFNPHSPEIAEKDSPTPSRTSSNSSYAHRLYHRSDTLVRKIRPQQHRDKAQHATTRSTPPLRSPTYGLPKVVGDSRDPLSVLHTFHGPGAEQTLQAFTTASAKTPIGPLKLPPKALKKIASSGSSERGSKHHSSDGSSPSKAGSLRLIGIKRPGILRSSASLDISQLPSSQHIQIPELPFPCVAGRNGQAIRSGIAARRKQQISSSSHTTPKSPMTEPPATETPRSDNSGSTPSKPFQSDESYFTSLRVKMVGRQGFTPTLMPFYEAETSAPIERPIPVTAAVSPPSTSLESKSPEPVVPTSAKQKRGSIFSVFGKSLLSKHEGSESTEPAHPSPTPEPTPPMRPAVHTTLATQATQGIVLPPYFAVPRQRYTTPGQSAGLASPASAISPTTTNNTATETISGSPSVPVTSDIITTPFTPLPPIRDKYDRSRRVSIEVPGKHGTHRPADTPFQSPDATPASQSTSAPALDAQISESPTAASSSSRKPIFIMRMLGLKRPLKSTVSIDVKRRRKAKTNEATIQLPDTSSGRRPSANGASPPPRLRKPMTTLASPVSDELKAASPMPASRRPSASFPTGPEEQTQSAPKWTS